MKIKTHLPSKPQNMMLYVKKEIKNLKNDCSAGFDTIPVKYLKPVSECIASPTTNIINNCIKTNSFPKMWKIVRVPPMQKVKVPTKPADYRPICLCCLWYQKYLKELF